jgi:hypothetical protein
MFGCLVSIVKYEEDRYSHRPRLILVVQVWHLDSLVQH